jgi:aspartyl-tRNA(Asn)/glutamyl-tRNA(Gln) amidotransferase subunit A
MTDELCFLTACELLRRYRARSLSPVEVARSILERITRVNRCVNAVHFVDAEGALAAAHASEERWLRGEPKGMLDGVPITLKDSLSVAGMPGYYGTSATAFHTVDSDDSPAAARLREHGAILIGKTTMPDFGMIPSGISSFFGVTRNPWKLDRNSGGSSAGAGAALAAGLGQLAVGTDLGGSVRIPAAFCGIVGLKPSGGRVPLVEPRLALVAGPMARTVEDAALLLNVISLPDKRDYSALPWDDRDYLNGIGAGVRGLKMGLMVDIGFGLEVEPEVRARVECAGALMAELGAIVEPLPPMFEESPEPDFDRMLQAYTWTKFSKLLSEQQAMVLSHIAAWARKTESLSATDLTRALIGIGETRRRVITACSGYDYVLTPTMAVEAFAAELPWTPGGTQHNPFCFPFNLSEQPALSVCCGFTSSGLPVGLQIIGRRFDDAGFLRVGHAFEAARPPLPRLPQLS